MFLPNIPNAKSAFEQSKAKRQELIETSLFFQKFKSGLHAAIKSGNFFFNISMSGGLKIGSIENEIIEVLRDQNYLVKIHTHNIQIRFDQENNEDKNDSGDNLREFEYEQN